MRYLALHAAAASLSCALLVTAQEMSYTTSIVTACFDKDAGMPTPGPGGPVPGRDCLIDVPGCGECDCNSCAHTATYTTQYPAFCSTGLADVVYTVTEIRSGMKEAPRVTDRPGVPEGFTTAVETCTVGGDEPLTKTMTYPIDGAPYVPVETVLAEHLDVSTGRNPAETGTAAADGKQGGDSGILVGAAPVRIIRDILLAAFGLVFAL
ncbi:uncharacterized protein F5Z01DRAFT_672817 [Emericellopsis atlantica]|uniref:Uncharacterized protein n=1 Tax=Emericellopsis atlantica TaxID=2614577 RepID=A0A9P7ZP41_9HYPO|nr:uncharacterized protein F5Z01DRAFT_672817 [Emericellopsis atlantica]KAG9255506.1 hypothetical protein F5Z01DRAFT_672817 [Emericellopsis atlantica]